MGAGALGSQPPNGGKGKGPPAPTNKGKGKGTGNWRTKVAESQAKLAEQAKALEPWKKLTASLPAGDVDAPRWDTAFAVGIPDEGTTAAVLFIGTLAGGFCVKASQQPAQEYFAACFMARCGCPVPRVRVVFKHEPEQEQIRAAIRSVAGQYCARGDTETSARVLSVLNHGLALPQLLVMELVPQAKALADTDAGIARELLDLPEGSRDGAAFSSALRLQALGRCFLADVMLAFRDRFARNPVLNPLYEEEVEWMSAQRLGAWHRGMDNGNNLLLTAEPLAGRAGIFSIDTHVMHVVRSTEAGAEPEDTGASERVRQFVAAVCTEAVAGSPKAPCLEFVRCFVKGQTGGAEGDQVIIEADFEAIKKRHVHELWCFAPFDQCAMFIRATPDADGPLTEEQLTPGEEFYVDRQSVSSDGVRYLHLADKRGWAFEATRHGDAMCVEVDNQTKRARSTKHLLLGLELPPPGRDIGHVLSDAALREVRLGVLGLLRELAESDLAQWLDAELAELQGERADACPFWAESARRVDAASLRAAVGVVREAAEAHREVFEQLAAYGEAIALAAEAASVGADPRLWRALPPAVRVALRKEEEMRQAGAA